jgi:hypothetical protein
MDQINADPKENWYRLAREKTDQQIVHASVLKYFLTKQEIRSVKTDKDLACHRFHSTYTANTSPTNVLNGLKVSEHEK